MLKSLQGLTINDEKAGAACPVSAPAVEELSRCDITADRLKEDFWADDGYREQRVFHENGIVQLGLGGGMWQSYAEYAGAEASFNKIFNADILFSCRSELDVTNSLQSTGRILFRAVKAGEPSTDNPCYFLEYADNGHFSFRIGRQSAAAQTYLNEWVLLEGDYKPYDFNNVKIGFLDENGGLRILVYFNDKPVINLLDVSRVPECDQAGHIFFINGNNRLFLRGVDDATAVAPVETPVKRGTVNGCDIYGIEQFSDYSFRDLITLLTARTFHDVNGAVIPYRIYLPSGYSMEKKYPIMMYLHGAGLRGNDNQQQLAYDRNFYKAFLDIQAECEMIFVIPQCNGKSWNDSDIDMDYVVGYEDFAFKAKGVKESPIGAALIHLLDALEEECSIDTTREYLSGASMGGLGSYGILARYPDRFAAGFIGCAAGDTEMADVYAKTPLWIGHGTLDPAIHIKRGREMAAVIKAAGGEVNFNEYPDRYHDFSTREDFDKAMEWVIKKVKVRQTV